MQLIVIASPTDLKDEHDYLHGLFAAGLTRFHLRKPHFSVAQMETYLTAIAEPYRRYVTLHSHWQLAVTYGLGGVHYPSAVTIDPMPNWKGRKSRALHTLTPDPLPTQLDYVLLSPVFNSISKPEHLRAFTTQALHTTLPRWRAAGLSAIALGGIDVDKIVCLHQWDLFSGVAVLGAIWRHHLASQGIAHFIRLQNACLYR